MSASSPVNHEAEIAMKTHFLQPIYLICSLSIAAVLLLSDVSMPARPVRANGIAPSHLQTMAVAAIEDVVVSDPATSSPCTGDGVYLYEDINYGGACLKWTADDPELGDDGWHDRASSIKFVGSYSGGRYKATLYEHYSYTGAFTTFSADDPWLGDDAIGNDSADSIRIQQVPFCDLVSEIPKTECEALVSFYNSTFGPYWTNRTGWLVTYTPCSWYGVTCANGHVTRLQLITNNLSGSLPASISNLLYLSYLRMDRNKLIGSIPASIGSLAYLGEFDLSYNLLSGSIPESMGNLSVLQKLYVAHNNAMTGALPHSLTNLSLDLLLLQ